MQDEFEKDEFMLDVPEEAGDEAEVEDEETEEEPVDEEEAL